MSTMHELEQGIRQEIRDEAAELLNEPNYEDRLHEMADGSVPVYTTNLMRLAAGDVYLAADEPEGGPAFDGSPTPANIVAANVYERLFRAANDEWEKVKTNAEECVNCWDLVPEDEQVIVNVEAADFSMESPYPGFDGEVSCKDCAGEVEGVAV